MPAAEARAPAEAYEKVYLSMQRGERYITYIYQWPRLLRSQPGCMMPGGQLESEQADRQTIRCTRRGISSAPYLYIYFSVFLSSQLNTIQGQGGCHRSALLSPRRYVLQGATSLLDPRHMRRRDANINPHLLPAAPLFHFCKPPACRAFLNLEVISRTAA